MNRTTLLKISYACAIALPLAIVHYLVITGRSQPRILLCLSLILLIPGRLVGYFWRDLIIARRLMDRKHWQESIPYLECFLTKVKQHLWLNLLIWISPSLYTTSALAMVLNNLGAAYLEIGSIEQAAIYLYEALKIDSLYPIPHYNLAVLERLRERIDWSDYHGNKAIRLGFSGSTTDRIIEHVKNIYARIEPMAID